MTLLLNYSNEEWCGGVSKHADSECIVRSYLNRIEERSCITPFTCACMIALGIWLEFISVHKGFSCKIDILQHKDIQMLITLCQVDDFQISFCKHVNLT